MKIAVLGANGQVGQALTRVLLDHTVIPLTRPEFDVTDPAVTVKIVELAPDIVINTVAMTDVDGCAKDPAAAYLVNTFGAQNAALACQQLDIALLHISTNEVFDGTADTPYHEFAPRQAINAYGQSKLAAEEMISQLWHKFYIVRTAWVFAEGGNNFPTKIIQAADKHGQLRVVTDEVSSPTYAPDLAAALAKLILTGHYGIYHFTNAGICSRYDYALEILQQTGRQQIPVEPITSDSFNRASTPPPYAPLQNNLGAALGITLRPWQSALSAYLLKWRSGI